MDSILQITAKVWAALARVAGVEIRAISAAKAAMLSTICKACEIWEMIGLAVLASREFHGRPDRLGAGTELGTLAFRVFSMVSHALDPSRASAMCRRRAEHDPIGGQSEVRSPLSLLRH